jgi:DNA invertase Pin-like site-specific DNA recombinase/peptidoglycan hydrolase-like protein with peptidoglycan-binding domain
LVAVLLLCLPAVAGAAESTVDRSTEIVLARGAGFDSVTGSDRVRQLQRTLRALGHRPGPIDGLYGPLTQGGVERFQQARGLVVDGVVGKNTGRELRESRLASSPATNNGSRARKPARGGASDAERNGTRAAETGTAVEPNAAESKSEARSEAPARSDTGGEADDGPFSGIEIPGYVLWLLGLGLGLIAAGLLLLRRRSRWVPDDSEPTVQGGAVAGRMFVAGESRDRSIGAFRGHAQAFSVTWGAQPTLRYLVVDQSKPEPFWVSMGEIDRLSQLPDAQAAADRAAEKEDSEAVEAQEEHNAGPGTAQSTRALGYASVRADDRLEGSHFQTQADAIETDCDDRGLELIQVVRDIEPQAGSDLKRPGLMYALETIAAGAASCLVVSGLDRLARSASDLGTLVEWFEHNNARLVAVDLDLDTATDAGRMAARALVAAGELDRRRLAERTRKGLAAARAKGGAGGRPAVSDRPALRERIATMRREGMTLQAIADALNEEGVPTLRGGAEWRPSSVQAAAGYKRPRRNRRLDALPSATDEATANGGGKER